MCDKINEDMYIVERGELPKRFGPVTVTGTRQQFLNLILGYKNIVLHGTARYPPGDYKLCIQKQLKMQLSVYLMLRWRAVRDL